MQSEEWLLAQPLKIIARLTAASNASLLAEVPGSTVKVIYKPIAGEAPLWDFPDGNLAARERLAYLISKWGGFNCVPTTVLREDQFGLGSIQQWIESEMPEDLTGVANSKDSKLRNLVLFDAVINNADRKFGHILFADGEVYGCDHGPTFNVENKLRTVLWQFRSLELTANELKQLADLKHLLKSDSIQSEVLNLITDDEYQALIARIEELESNKVFPEPSPDWPAIPWPPV